MPATINKIGAWLFLQPKMETVECLYYQLLKAFSFSIDKNFNVGSAWKDEETWKYVPNAFQVRLVKPQELKKGHGSSQTL